MKLTAICRARSLGIGVGEERRQPEPGVVDQDVEPTEPDDRLSDDPIGAAGSARSAAIVSDLQTRRFVFELTGQRLQAIAPPGRQDEPASSVFPPGTLAGDRRAQSRLKPR